MQTHNHSAGVADTGARAFDVDAGAGIDAGVGARPNLSSDYYNMTRIRVDCCLPFLVVCFWGYGMATKIASMLA